MTGKIKNLLKEFSIGELIWTGVVVIVVIIRVAVIIAACVSQTTNRISEGVVVDKQYCEAYTTLIYNAGSKTLIPQYHPERFLLTIEGEKNGEIVQYSFRVSESEYHDYHIGDYYESEEKK